MLRNFFSQFWTHRAQFFRYFVVGTTSFVIDFGLLILFKEVFGWKPVFAVVVMQVIVLLYNFTLNKYWSFKSTESSHRQVARYLILQSWNYVFGVGMMYLFNELIQFDYRLVRLGTVMLMTLWNFLLYKYWVYQTVHKVRKLES
jgi:putative flippase GtrA